MDKNNKLDQNQRLLLFRNHGLHKTNQPNMKTKRPYDKAKARETRLRNRRLKEKNKQRALQGLPPLPKETTKKRTYKYTGLHRGRAGRPLRTFKKESLAHLNTVQSRYMTLSGNPYRTKTAPTYRGQYPVWRYSQKVKECKQKCKQQQQYNKALSGKKSQQETTVRSLAV